MLRAVTCGTLLILWCSSKVTINTNFALKIMSENEEKEAVDFLSDTVLISSHNCHSSSVTRFGEISPLRQNFDSLGLFFQSLCNVCKITLAMHSSNVEATNCLE